MAGWGRYCVHWRIQGAAPPRGRTPLPGPNSFIFMQFSALLELTLPSRGKSWIRHCAARTFFWEEVVTLANMYILLIFLLITSTESDQFQHLSRVGNQWNHECPTIHGLRFKKNCKNNLMRDQSPVRVNLWFLMVSSKAF